MKCVPTRALWSMMVLCLAFTPLFGQVSSTSLQGTVTDPKVEGTGDPGLAEAVLVAVKKWRFTPPTCNGKPAKLRVTQEYEFKLVD